MVGTGDVFDMSFRIRRVDGVYRWFKTRAVPLRDPAGRILKWFGSNTDIEDFMNASNKLEVQLERMQLLDRTTRAIGSHQELRKVFEVVLRSLEENLGIEFGCICLYRRSPRSSPISYVGDEQRGGSARQIGITENAQIAVDAEGARTLRARRAGLRGGPRTRAPLAIPAQVCSPAACARWWRPR